MKKKRKMVPLSTFREMFKTKTGSEKLFASIQIMQLSGAKRLYALAVPYRIIMILCIEQAY